MPCEDLKKVEDIIVACRVWDDTGIPVITRSWSFDSLNTIFQHRQITGVANSSSCYRQSGNFHFYPK